MRPLTPTFDSAQSIRACKWVDEVVENVPYVLNEAYLNDVVFGKYKVDYVVHGDDPCLDAEGNDVFATSKAVGKYKVWHCSSLSAIRLCLTLWWECRCGRRRSSGQRGFRQLISWGACCS